MNLDEIFRECSKQVPTDRRSRLDKIFDKYHETKQHHQNDLGQSPVRPEHGDLGSGLQGNLPANSQGGDSRSNPRDDPSIYGEIYF